MTESRLFSLYFGDLFLILKCGWGAAGSAVATVVAQAVGAFFLLKRLEIGEGNSIRVTRVKFSDMKKLLTTMLPLASCFVGKVKEEDVEVEEE